MAEESKTIVIGKKKLYIAIIAIIAIAAVAAFLYFRPSGNAEYITPDNPILGNQSAGINVVEFSDYECPFCQAAEGANQQVISQLKQSDPTWQAPVPGVIESYVNTGKVRLVFRQFPVHSNNNPALASECAKEQGRFWEYHNLLFENYDSLSVTDLEKYAVDMNLNATQFNECLESQRYLGVIQRDLSDGQALGVSGTPTFFIGNDQIGYEKVVGAQSFAAFAQVIDLMLSQ